MRPAFIVAQYKCGTSWLLSALCAHPAVMGLREIDVIRGAYYVKGSAERRPATPEERLDFFFGRTAWCSTNIRTEIRDRALPQPGPRRFDRPQSVSDLDPDVVYWMANAIATSQDPNEALDAFLRGVTDPAPEQATHVVLKGADQVAVFDQLQAWQPDAPKIAITRDGRDASISALHYKKLMEGKPWYAGETDYWKLLQGWSVRADMIRQRAESGELLLVRYEDLTLDFENTLATVLRHLGLDHSPELLTDIRRESSFEKKTGRERGTDGTGVIRKGAIREWVEELDGGQRERAWDIAGKALSAFGYSADGELHDLPRTVAGQSR